MARLECNNFPYIAIAYKLLTKASLESKMNFMSSTLILTEKTTLDTGEFIFKLYTPPFSSIDQSMIKQVYGIILNDQNQILLCNHKNGMVLLPGGKREAVDNGSIIETLKREAIEEANVIIDESTIAEGFYQSVETQGDLESYQVRFIARAKEINEFKADPDEGIISVFWVGIEDLHNHLGWGKADAVIQDIARKYIAK
jgi:8-oxo-dGTP pyrophosphatase MutT (NUDIX family)